MIIISSPSTLWHPKPHFSWFVSLLEWFKALFENQNSPLERSVFKSTQLKQLWAAENEANMSPLQKLTCLSVFEVLLRFLSFEHSKHIQKNLWLRIFDLMHEFFKKIIFFRFSKNDHRFDIWSLWVP